MHKLRTHFLAGEAPVPTSPVMEKQNGSASHGASLSAADIRRRERRRSHQRTQDRHRLSEEEATMLYNDEELGVGLINVSSGGVMIETEIVPNINDIVGLRFGDCIPIETTVRWVAKGRVGLEFSDETEIIDDEGNIHSVVEAVLGSADSLDERRSSLERRGNSFRHGLYWTGELCINDDGVDVRVRNISATGAMVRATENHDWLVVGTEIELDLGMPGCILGEIRWRREEELGLRFFREFDLRRLSADTTCPPGENAWVKPEYLKTKNLPPAN
jgi:hypothetical protein